MPRNVGLSISAEDGPMTIYDAEPEGDPVGAVIVLQEAFGVNEHVEDVTRRFAASGFRAVAPHLYHRTGDPVLAYDDIQQVMPHTEAVAESGLLADLDATLQYLETAGFATNKVGIVGFCMGGSAAFYASVRYPLAAGVSFYGGGVASGRFGFPSQIELAPQLHAPWLGLFGDRDQGIPVDQVEALRAAASRAEVATEIVRYPDAGHGFHSDGRSSYDKPSAIDAWRRTIDWLNSHLSER
jgi:carboxymethylenebutenolidase